jgi:hypothetical protein
MTKAVKKTHGYDSTAQATAKNTRLVWCWNQLQKRTTFNTAAPYEHLPSTCLPSLTSSASYNAANTPGGSKSKQDPQGSLQIHCRFTLLHFCLHSKQRNRYQVGCILIGHPIFGRIQGYSLVFPGIPNYFDILLCIYVCILVYIYV